MLPFVDIGIVKRISCVEVGMGTPSLLIETDKGVFRDRSEKVFCYSCMLAMEALSLPNGTAVWGLSKSMSFCGSMAAMERKSSKIKVGDEIPLMTDEEGWRFMLDHKFPDFAKDAWNLYQKASWVDVEGNESDAPNWIRPYWVKLLYHRQDEISNR